MHKRILSLICTAVLMSNLVSVENWSMITRAEEQEEQTEEETGSATVMVTVQEGKTAECAVKVEHVLHAVGVFILDDAVIRRDNSRVDAERGKRLRQSADNVRKSAGLAQRSALRRGKQNVRQRGEVLFTQYFTKLFFHGVLPFVIF